MRALRHLLSTRWSLTRRFTAGTLEALEAAIAASERQHRGEIRFAVEAALDPATVRRDSTPRDRALEVFTELEVWDTVGRNGVLIYVLLAERAVEIVADRGCEGRISGGEWREVCVAMERDFHDRRWRAGSVAGVEAVSTLLAREFPPRPDRPDADELPNRPAML